MNVLTVVTGLPDKKSPARSVFNLAFIEELRKNGIKVSVLYLRALNPKKSFLEVRDLHDTQCFEIRSTFPEVGFLDNSLFFPCLFRLILKNTKLSQHLKNIDIIHAIGGEAVEASYIISEKYDTPMVSQFIGSDLNVSFSYFLLRKNFIKGIKKSGFLTFNSRGLQELFISKLGNDNRGKVLYRGVKLNEYKYNFKKSTSVKILFLGGFPNNGNLKGGHTLLNAIKLLNKQELPCQVEFVIGGPNSKNFSEYGNDIINTKINLNWIGSVNKSLVKEFMQSSNIVLIPSLAEGVPNVLYEAMASGNMVIGTNVGGIPEVLEHNNTGLLIAKDDPNALMKAILKSINNLDQIERFAIEGRKKIEDMDYNKFIKGYIMVYNSMICD